VKARRRMGSEEARPRAKVHLAASLMVGLLAAACGSSSAGGLDAATIEGHDSESAGDGESARDASDAVDTQTADVGGASDAALPADTGEPGDGPSDLPEPSDTLRLKVLTYNTGFASSPSSDDRARLVALILDQSADIIGFQELGSRWRGEVEEGLRDTYDFYDGDAWSNSNPIAIKKGALSVLEARAVPLEIAGCRFSYVVTYVRLQTSTGRELVVANDHFCRANPEAHARQFTSVIADAHPELPRIVTGDLNSRDGSDTMNYLLHQGDLEKHEDTGMMGQWVVVEPE
jgi:endonuclease/exonuclease/phosphatase family metal-dependent hydrolase